ncbi:MAG: PRC-barrel domain-containing protein [Methermicoccaceae archaeon]
MSLYWVENMNIEMSSLLGLNLYTLSGTYVGRIRDVVIESSEGAIASLAVVDVNESLFDVGGKGIYLPYRWITAVDDVALMVHPVKVSKREEEVPEEESDFRAAVH